MPTTPEKAIRTEWLPRLSLSQLFAVVLLVAGIMWTFVRARADEPWAIAMVLAIAGVVLFFILSLILAIAAWLPGLLLVGKKYDGPSNPFANGQLPPTMTSAPKESD